MVLRVCVQFKHTQQLPPQATETAIRTTDPFTWLSTQTKDNDSPTCSNPPMRDKLVEAIRNLGNGTNKAGHCGVLGVLFSHPSLPDTNTLEEAAKGGLPLATVSVSHLESADSDVGQSILSLANMTLRRADLKRKGSDEIDGGRPKRPRSQGARVQGGAGGAGSRGAGNRVQEEASPQGYNAGD